MTVSGAIPPPRQWRKRSMQMGSERVLEGAELYGKGLCVCMCMYISMYVCVLACVRY